MVVRVEGLVVEQEVQLVVGNEVVKVQEEEKVVVKEFDVEEG